MSEANFDNKDERACVQPIEERAECRSKKGEFGAKIWTEMSAKAEASRRTAILTKQTTTSKPQAVTMD